MTKKVLLCCHRQLFAVLPGGISDHTFEVSHVADYLNVIRGAVPGVPVGGGTGEWIEPGQCARQELLRSWTVLPDYTQKQRTT